MQSSADVLFEPVKLGRMQLAHRVVMAPLTRYRADKNHIHGDLAVEYYSQRASVPGTLLITEATIISPQAGGNDYAPGIHTEEQISAWKRITDAVHAKGSFIYAHLWALGRVAIPEILAREGGFPLVGASPKPLQGRETPRPLTISEIQQYVHDYAQAARNAIRAGFDGVEIQCANGYLLDQFLQNVTNEREDKYGGSIENRSRFGLEVVKVVADAIGPDRTSIRLSPWTKYQDMRMADPIPQFLYFIRELQRQNPDLAYLHMIESRGDEEPGCNDVFWLAALPNTHPLHPITHRTNPGRSSKKKKNALQTLLHTVGIDHNRFETIKPIRRSPKWEPGFKTHLDVDKSRAINSFNKLGNSIVVYADGSSINGGVGAAAALYEDDLLQSTLLKHLGPSSEHTVYEAELVGLALATQLACTRPDEDEIILAADNKAAIQALRLTKGASSHYLVDGIIKQFDTHKENHPSAEWEYRWIPGHVGIEGNETADKGAKRAAEGISNQMHRLPGFCNERHLRINRSASKQHYTELLKQEWRDKFIESKRFEHMYEIDPKFAPEKFRKRIKQMARRHASILVQLRSKHMALNKHLHTIGKADSATCPACHSRQETVFHFLMSCPGFAEQRHVMECKIGYQIRNLKSLLSSQKNEKHLFNYVHATKRLASTYKNLAME